MSTMSPLPTPQPWNSWFVVDSLPHPVQLFSFPSEPSTDLGVTLSLSSFLGHPVSLSTSWKTFQDDAGVSPW